MGSRRDFLRAGLTVCGCSACGLIGLSERARAAQADARTAIHGAGYDLWFVGAQRDTIMNGKLAAALDLKTLAGVPHLYAVGPFEQLRGEVTIANSRPSLAHVASDGSIAVRQSFAMGVPFFVWAEVPRWHRLRIPPQIRSYEDLAAFVPKAAAGAGLDAERPLPFLVDGIEDLIEFHIVNRVGDGPVNPEIHQKFQILFTLERAAATIVGFHSTKYRGVFTPGDSSIHIHFQTLDNSRSGHIQKLALGEGAVLSLPAMKI